MALTLGASSLVRVKLAGETHAGYLFRSSFFQIPSSFRRSLCVVASSPDPFPASSEPASPPKKITFKKGEVVRVDKEKYLNSVEYLAVGHPPHFKGLDYIYEDRGEILDVRIFETGEYALLSWAGIPTSPAWLPTYMLIKSEKLSYKRT